jgi:hypothetical protein
MLHVSSPVADCFNWWCLAQNGWFCLSLVIDNLWGFFYKCISPACLRFGLSHKLPINCVHERVEKNVMVMVVWTAGSKGGFLAILGVQNTFTWPHLSILLGFFLSIWCALQAVACVLVSLKFGTISDCLAVCGFKASVIRSGKSNQFVIVWIQLFRFKVNANFFYAPQKMLG